MSYSGFQSQYPSMAPNPTGYQSGQALAGQQTANPWSQMMGGYGGYNPYSNPIMGYSNPTSLMSNMGYGGYNPYAQQGGYNPYPQQGEGLGGFTGVANPYAQQGGYGGYSPGPIGGNTPSPYPSPSPWQQGMEVTEEDLTKKQQRQWANMQKKAGKLGFYDIALNQPDPKLEQFGAGYNTPGGYSARGGWAGMDDIAREQTWGPGPAPDLSNPVDLTRRQERQWANMQKKADKLGFYGVSLKQQAPEQGEGLGGFTGMPAPYRNNEYQSRSNWPGGFSGLNLPTGRYGESGGGLPENYGNTPNPQAPPAWLKRQNPSGPGNRWANAGAQSPI